HEVQLVNQGEEVVLDLDGNPYTIQTDASGYYKFDIFRKGNYAVRVVPPSDYRITQLSDNRIRGNHFTVQRRSTQIPLDITRYEDRR
ncbi:SdrD B-like domain-containing protein, partial [Vibrio parahaemolyticus]|uniref:SdrD B-like domain-containing protein n=1 Tax=Vibrio parahaemolyticus TaxID=670 RepID=UPI002110EAFF